MVKGITGWPMTIRDKLYEDIAEKISDMLQQGRVLDVGTGKGLLPIKIAQRNSGLEIYGVDISDHEIEAARKNSTASGLPNAPRFEVGNVSSLSFKDEYFDLAVSTFGLHHWPDQVGGLNEVYRVLKPGGEAWIYDHWQNPSKPAKEKLRKQFGWLPSILALWHLKLVRSSMTAEMAKNLLEDPNLKFQKKQLNQHGIFLQMKLQKAAE